MAESAEERIAQENVFAIIKPAVEKIDTHVAAVRQSQLDLRSKIDEVSNELQRIAEEQPLNIDLDPYINRLVNTKRRVVLVSNIVQNVQDRLNRLHRNVSQEKAKKQATLQQSNLLKNVEQGSLRPGTSSIN